MANNGVVHRTVSDDLEGCTEILRWLGYVPERVGSDPPIRFWNSDPVDRPVAYTPEQLCDPRAAIQGTCHPTADVNGSPHPTAGVNGSPHPTVRVNESPHPTADESLQSDTWLGGIFDRGSFTEALAGWARTVVTGRARLGGIPVGVIAVQTQAVMCYIPADPGQPDSAERAVPQAGQV
jgi:acetyl-CoA carboxylase/biotin carboxylase 1